MCAFDSDPAAIVTASPSSSTGRSAHLSFIAANAYQLPLPAGFADLVVCRKLLCVASRVDAAVEEMCRVVKAGGIVVAVEPAARQEFHDSEDEEYAALCRSLDRAFHRGWARTGVDQRVGLKVPGVFLRHGLSDVIAEGMCQTYLLSDPRRPSEEVVGQLRTEAGRHPRRTVQLLLHGGMTPEDLREHRRLARRRLTRFMADPQAIAGSPYVRMSTFTVTVGRKPRSPRGGRS